MVLTKGFMAIRTGYFISSLKGGTPFARAVVTYGFCSSSSRFARINRIVMAMPDVPTTMMGIQMWASKSTKRGQLHGAFRYSGEKRPPALTPKTE